MFPTQTLVIVLMTSSVTAQIKPDIIFRFVAPGIGRTPDTLDVDLLDTYGHLFYTMVCKSPQNEVTVRVSPKDGTIDLIDESRGLTNGSVGARTCLPSTTKDIVVCKESNFCSNDNNCVATLTSSCPALGAKNTWQMTQYFDVTVNHSPDGGLTVSRCYGFCERYTADKLDTDEDDQGISDTAVGLIVAGVITLAALIIIAVVVWKIRDSRNLRLESEKAHKPHHIEYAT